MTETIKQPKTETKENDPICVCGHSASEHNIGGPCGAYCNGMVNVVIALGLLMIACICPEFTRRQNKT